MQQEQEYYRYYALSIKGGFYSKDGQIVEKFEEAILFEDSLEAKNFRDIHDPSNRVERATLLLVNISVLEL
ncbi:MAG: hypothetical protein H0X31_00860 [Nostocaceae cyanobacterium]|nr:hypothetical protein [Nostocaceae cyanobacterium]